MKKIILALIISLIASGVQAQLSNTKWKTMLSLDNPVEVYFNFSKDTLDVTVVMDNSSLETMKYTVRDSVLTIQKLYGHSECDSESVGKYKFKIDGNEMSLKVSADPCDDRAKVIGDIKLTKAQ